MKSTTIHKKVFIALITLALQLYTVSNAHSQIGEPSSVGLGDGLRLYDSIPLSGRLLFVTTSAEGQNTIYSVTLSTQQLTPLYVSSEPISFPAWSPGGLMIVFSSYRAGTNRFYLLSSDSSNPIELPYHSKTSSTPTWSSDGKNILFSSESDNDSSNVFSYSVIDKTITQLTKFKGKNNFPDISPNGITIAYSTTRFWPGLDICLFTLKTNTERCILTGRTSYTEPRYSNNGKFIAFTSGEQSVTSVGIYSLEKKNDFAPQITRGSSVDKAWSPDDRYLAFSANSKDESRFDLLLFDIERETTTPLITGKTSLRYPSWTKEVP